MRCRYWTDANPKHCVLQVDEPCEECGRYETGGDRVTYKVRCLKQIHGSFSALSSEDVWLYRDVELPFPPFPGLRIWDGDWGCVVAGVCYRVLNGWFFAHTEPDKEIYRAGLRRERCRPIEEIVAEYVAEGWFVCERGRSVYEP